MGKKYDSLNWLVAKNINVHSFKLIDNEQGLLSFAKENDSFSIRFDRESQYHQLPFYTYDLEKFSTGEEATEYLKKIALEASNLNCSMLCSIGHRYDSIEICNFVMKIESDNTFTLEWSTQKVPLRNMYEYPTSYISGSLKDNIKTMKIQNELANPLKLEQLEAILVWAMNLKMVGVSIEGTLYPEKVGIKHENIVCWQID